MFDFHPIHISQTVCSAAIKMWAPARCFLWNGSSGSWKQIECVSLGPIQIALVTHYYELLRPGAELKWDTAQHYHQPSQPGSKQSPIWILPDLTDWPLSVSPVYNVITAQSDVHVQLQQMGGECRRGGNSHGSSSVLRRCHCYTRAQYTVQACNAQQCVMSHQSPIIPTWAH